LKDPVLLGRAQPGEQRQNLRVGAVLAAQRGRGVADLPLPGEEDEDVARTFGAQLVDGLTDRLDLVADVLALGALALRRALVLLQHLDQRSVTDLDGEGPAGHLDDRGSVEVRRETLWVDCGRVTSPSGRAASAVAA
jgi:hypothetical protein